jgi:predicted chitinase
MQIPKTVLTALGVSDANADKHLDALNAAMGQHAINTPLRVSHFLAQVVHESGHMKATVENLNYSPEGLLRLFPKYFKTPDLANAYARKPEKIANRVYGGRMGNGNEASGDGYRYRGRGLIQLTGKSNYQAFSQWIGEDLVANPNLVAERLAAHSAVFYWDTNGLNTLADTDDLAAVTRRINGGLIGFADRRLLLEKAKRALSSLPIDPANAAPSFAPTHRVSPPKLNLRRTPGVAASNLIASLAQGTPVEVLDTAGMAGWTGVRVVLNGVLRQGFVSAEFLEPLPRARGARALEPTTAAAPVETIPPAYLPRELAEVSRTHSGRRAFPLGEASRPRLSAKTPEARAKQLLAMIAWLDCENREHQRYQPRQGTNYCTTYAADHCYLAGAYLPQVWWTRTALMQMARGQEVEVSYDHSVRELSANALYDWFNDQGTGFGWHQEVNLISLQEAANAGEVCVIVARNRDINRPGHVTLVVPEHPDYVARRDASGDVLRPVESQAGSRNRRFAVPRSAWWLGSRFECHAFWRHPLA